MTDNVNIKLDGNKLKEFNKTFDGLPILHFRKIFYIPFLMALGSIIMDGVPLRETVNGTDIGGANNNAVANEAQTRQREMRIHRIFSILMAHINPACALYKELEQDFGNNGLIALRYVCEDNVGNLPISETELTKMNTKWLKFNFQSENIKIDKNTVANFGDRIQVFGGEFDPIKTPREMYDKFLEGLPPQLQDRVINERSDPNPRFAYPAQYPAQANHPLRGQAHPFAGQKNIKAVITSFSKIWMTMCDTGRVVIPKSEIDVNWAGKGRGKGTKGKGKGSKGYKGGRGYGEDKGPFSGVGTRVPVRPLNEKVCCYKCGGLGHVAKIKCEDGSTMYCATQIQIDDKLLNGIQYPHIPSAAERRAGNANNVKEEEAPKDEEPEAAGEESEESESEFNAQFAGAEDIDYEDY